MKPYYQEENITIYNGDCLEVMDDIPNDSINLIVTDPPYKLDNHGGGQNETWFRNLNQTNHLEFISNGFNKEILDKFIDICFPLNAYIFCSNKQISKLMSSWENEKYSTTLLVWQKLNPIPFANGKYVSDIEFITFVRGKSATFNNLKINEMSKVFRFTTDNERHHPAQKPLDLIKKIISISSKPGDTILDPFLGSGTTARACKDLGRKCIGIEISKEYCDIAIKRLGQEVLF